MEEIATKERLAAWSDIVSLVLLGFAILVAGIDPRRRIWGRNVLLHMLILIAISINVIFCFVRLIAEGVLVETGPREFLLLSVIYCARWLWLYVGMWLFNSRCHKAFKVALELKQLKTVRLGSSTRPLNSKPKTQKRCLREGFRALLSGMTNSTKASQSQAGSSTSQRSENTDQRHGQKELVIRRGSRTLPSGHPYWRGVEEFVKRFERNGSNIYFVRLVERELHGDRLNVIGSYDYKKLLDVEGTDALYKKIYELVLTCCSASPELQVDYSRFLVPLGKVAATTAQAVRVGAIKEEPLGDVARRVAADACYYVYHDHAELRTNLQVELINECLEQAAKTHLGLCIDDQDALGYGTCTV